MLDRKLWGKFELVEISQAQYAKQIVHISKDKGRLRIPKLVFSQLSWKANERVNLYRFGETFLLHPDATGLLTIRVDGGSAVINSKNLCLELLARTHSTMQFDSWIEENGLFFKPLKNQEV